MIHLIAQFRSAIWHGFLVALLSYVVLQFVIGQLIPEYGDPYPPPAPRFKPYGIAILVAIFATSTVIGVFAGKRAARHLSKAEVDAHCQKCGYDLTGNVSGVCRECGTECKPTTEVTS